MTNVVPVERIERLILLIRGHKVMQIWRTFTE
jgi:hypothetical protein